MRHWAEISCWLLCFCCCCLTNFYTPNVNCHRLTARKQRGRGGNWNWLPLIRLMPLTFRRKTLSPNGKWLCPRPLVRRFEFKMCLVEAWNRANSWNANCESKSKSKCGFHLSILSIYCGISFLFIYWHKGVFSTHICPAIKAAKSVVNCNCSHSRNSFKVLIVVDSVEPLSSQQATNAQLEIEMRQRLATNLYIYIWSIYGRFRKGNAFICLNRVLDRLLSGNMQRNQNENGNFWGIFGGSLIGSWVLTTASCWHVAYT